jgi:hypothetical protein
MAQTEHTENELRVGSSITVLPLRALSSRRRGLLISGLVPFNRFIFDGDVDFAPSFVTDRPFNSSKVPPIDDSIEIPASNDNIVQEGQTPVPVQKDQTPVKKNHVTANVLSCVNECPFLFVIFKVVMYR